MRDDAFKLFFAVYLADVTSHNTMDGESDATGVRAIRKVGEGGFGSVFVARDKATNFEVALKVLSKAKNKQQNIKSEIRVMSMAMKCSICSLYRVSEDKKNVYLVTEFVNGSTMRESLNTFGRLNEERARKYFSEIVDSVSYLHSRGVVHRDLKLENIMIDANDRIRLIDFGLATEDTRERSICGSTSYFAPEMVVGREYDSSVDIWSLGVVLYTMLHGYMPFSENINKNIFQSILFSDPQFEMFITDDVIDLIQRMLEKDPTKRISISEIKNHSWLNNNEFQYDEFIRENTIGDDIKQEILSHVTPDETRQAKLVSELFQGVLSEDVSLYKMIHDNVNFNEARKKERCKWSKMCCKSDLLLSKRCRVNKRSNMHFHSATTNRFRKATTVPPKYVIKNRGPSIFSPVLADK